MVILSRVASTQGQPQCITAPSRGHGLGGELREVVGLGPSRSSGPTGPDETAQISVSVLENLARIQVPNGDGLGKLHGPPGPVERHEAHFDMQETHFSGH